MIAIVHSIYSQSVHTLALNAGLMDNDAERYCNATHLNNVSMVVASLEINVLKIHPERREHCLKTLLMC